MSSGGQANDTDGARSLETLDALDADPGHPLPLVLASGAIDSPLVISFPHVGLEWPVDFLRPRPQVNFGRNADYEVHRLYPGANAAGATTVRAIYSRLLVDLNRAEDDVSGDLVPDHPAPAPRPALSAPGGRIPNRGVLWDTAVGNIPILTAPVSFAELEIRLDRYYRPYYRALDALLERRRERFGHAILLEAHSMPGTVGGELILGTLEGGSCSPSIEALALDALSREDPSGVRLDVRLNEPYRGGHLVRAFGRPERSVHALQVEVSRALYMDEASLQVWIPPVDAHQDDGAADDARLLTPTRPRLRALLNRLEDLVRALAAPP
ncbi:MAG: N-formylglutamate amidohydrolase [Nannocystaceae bacterium]